MNVLHALRPAALAAATCLLLAPVAASAYTGLYVFGDSLSDTGNLFAMTGSTFPPAPYFNGRFSDGPLAVEHLAAGLGLSGAQFQDMAIAGARTGTAGQADADVGQATGMLTQLANFQAAQGAVPLDSGALYLVWGGANDLRDGLVAQTPGLAINNAVINLSNIVGTLHAMGARHFLLPNAPDLGLVPEVNQYGPAASAGASFVSELFNQALAGAYGSMASAWSDEHFHYYDVMAAQRALTAGAPGNGLTNTTDACLVPGVSLCATPGTYIYWDSIHPTAFTHSVLGQGMLAAAVPEPQAWLMMAAGVALLGTLRRRRA